MRSTNLCVIALLVGCAGGAGGSRGVTHREHLGSIQVVFTNATPDKMCDLRMSFEAQKQMGDNWLPEDGLPSGKSIEFKVRHGTYQATWSTCKDGDKPYYAGTLIGELAIGIDQQTQLFAYTADHVAPTKRAAVLTRDYKIVKFSGQPVGPIDRTAPATPKVDMFAKVEASFSRNGAPPPATTEPRFEKFSAADMIDPKAKRTKKRVKPSFSRKVVGAK